MALRKEHYSKPFYSTGGKIVTVYKFGTSWGWEDERI